MAKKINSTRNVIQAAKATAVPAPSPAQSDWRTKLADKVDTLADKACTFDKATAGAKGLVRTWLRSRTKRFVVEACGIELVLAAETGPRDREKARATVHNLLAQFEKESK